MPFIINGQKVNKPIYKGAVLNAMHVWLQNHWTGTPNASASTLSQDGQVVATNLLWTPLKNTRNTTVTQTDDGFTITTNTTYTGNGDDHNLYFTNMVVGETYHLHAETDNVLTTTLPNASVWADGFSAYYISNTYLLSPSVIDNDITAIDNSIHRLSFKCGMTAGDHVTWRRIGLYTAADWQAMQARGVTWFDGDSYVRGVV